MAEKVGKVFCQRDMSFTQARKEEDLIAQIGQDERRSVDSQDNTTYSADYRYDNTTSKILYSMDKLF